MAVCLIEKINLTYIKKFSGIVVSEYVFMLHYLKPWCQFHLLFFALKM